jgi:hypothetical protein
MGEATARSAIQPTVQHVCDGDRPSPYQTAWREAMTQVEAAVVQARIDRGTARQLLALRTARRLGSWRRPLNYDLDKG